MRILLTTDTIGGVWTFSRELIDRLLEDRHSVALVSFGQLCSESQRSWLRATTLAHGGRFLWRESEGPLEWMQENHTAFSIGSEVLLEAAREFHPDVLHSNQFCWGALPIEIPKLITVHSDVMSWAAACRPEVLHGSAWLTRYASLVQHGLLGANVIVAPTAWMGDALRTNFEVPSRIDIVPNGRSIPKFSQQPERLHRAVSAGRLWDEGKGISTLLEINTPMPLYLAGEEHFEAARVSPDAGAITPVGSLSENDLFDFLRRSTVYIAPSWYEPFGLAPLEAALCGCAIVARDLPSLREVWKEAAVYFRTKPELEQLLSSLMQDRLHLEAVQRACYRRASQFTAKRMAQEYLALYASMLQPIQGSHPAPEEMAAHVA